MRILVVEDDFISRNLMVRFLTPLGTVETGEDGKKGVEAFEKALKKGSPFDLVTLDIMMPQMDGHAALQKIRALEKQIGVPQNLRARVLMTTALDDVKNITAAFRELCDDYVVKPVRKPVLFEKIAELGFTVPQTPAGS
ncbi:MAG: response regulator [Planctomycetes bacterium]|nr:response regulator [Planctomycetota bacterium]